MYKELHYAWLRTSESKAAFSPKSLGDPVALETERMPTKPGGINVQTHRF